MRQQRGDDSSSESGMDLDRLSLNELQRETATRFVDLGDKLAALERVQNSMAHALSDGEGWLHLAIRVSKRGREGSYRRWHEVLGKMEAEMNTEG